MIELLRSIPAQSFVAVVEFITVLLVILWYFSTDIWDNIVNSINSVLSKDQRSKCVNALKFSIYNTVCNILYSLAFGFNLHEVIPMLSSGFLFVTGIYFISIGLKVFRVRIMKKRGKYEEKWKWR